MYEEGLDALYDGHPRRALRIAKQLEKLRSSAAFDIRANAYLQLGNRSKALDMLREGTTRYPTVARLWFLTGTFLSDAGEYEAALKCFDKAAHGHGGKPHHADHDRSIVFLRMGDFKQALRISESVSESLLPTHEWWNVLLVRACAHEGLGDLAEAMALIDAAVARFPHDGPETRRGFLIEAQQRIHGAYKDAGQNLVLDYPRNHKHKGTQAIRQRPFLHLPFRVPY